MEWILAPWPWYVSGPLIGLTVPFLLVAVGKPFGVSSSFRHLCSICSPNTTIGYLRENDWRQESWNLFFVVGIVENTWPASPLRVCCSGLTPTLSCNPDCHTD